MDHHKGEYSHGPSGAASLFFIGFAAIGAFFLVTEHRAHLYGALPWLLLLAVPFLHIFMHAGHSHGGHRDESGAATDGQASPGTGHTGSPPIHSH